MPNLFAVAGEAEDQAVHLVAAEPGTLNGTNDPQVTGSTHHYGSTCSGPMFKINANRART